MRRITFNYPNTCPKIDREIARAEGEIDNFLDSLLEEACPLLSTFTRKELVTGYTERLCEFIRPAFEAVRETNEDMRTEAEAQIASCHDDIDTLESEIDSLKSELRDAA